MTKTHTRNRWLISTTIAAIAIAATFIVRSNYRSNNLEKVSPRHGPIVEAVYGLGTVTAARQYEVKVAITTTIARIYVEEGQSVPKGAMLVSFQEGGQFRAPFAGTVTRVAFDEADAVTPGVPVIRLENIKEPHIEVSLEQQGALRVKAGHEVRLSFESIRGEKFSGKVRTIVPRQGEFIVIVDVPGLPAAVLPGMTADVAIIVGQRDNAWLIPVLAIDNGRVVIDRDGKTIKQPVKIGTMDGTWAEVIEGDIRATDQVFVKRQQ